MKNVIKNIKLKHILLFILILILTLFLILDSQANSRKIKQKNIELEKQLAELQSQNSIYSKNKQLKREIKEAKEEQSSLLNLLKSKLDAEKLKYKKITSNDLILDKLRANLLSQHAQINAATKDGIDTTEAQQKYHNEEDEYNEKLAAHNTEIDIAFTNLEKVNNKYNKEVANYNNSNSVTPSFKKVIFSFATSPISSLFQQFAIPKIYSQKASNYATPILLILILYILIPVFFRLKLNHNIKQASDLIELGLAKKILKEVTSKDGTVSTRVSKLILPKTKFLKKNSELQLTLASTNITEELLKNSLEQLSAFYLINNAKFETVDRVNNNTFILKASTLPEKVLFEEHHPKNLKPMTAFAGIDNKNENFIIDFSKTSACYISGAPRAGKSVLIQSILESVSRSVDYNIHIVAASTKPNDFFFLTHYSRYDAVVINMNTPEGFDQLAAEFKKIEITERAVQKIIEDNKITNPELHKAETLRAEGYELPPRMFFCLDEISDYLKVEKADNEEERDKKLKIINLVKIHARRTSRYCSIPLLTASQIDTENSIDLSLKMMHLRISSRTNSAMSLALTGDSKLLVDPTFTEGKFGVATEDGVKIIKAAFYDPSISPEISINNKTNAAITSVLSDLQCEVTKKIKQNQKPKTLTVEKENWKITNSIVGPTHTAHTVTYDNNKIININIKNLSSEKQIAHQINLQLRKQRS
jgi:hypothetical protein